MSLSARRLIVSTTVLAAVSSFGTAGAQGRAQSGASTILVTIRDAELSVAPSSVLSGNVVFKIVNRARISRDFEIANKKTQLILPGRSATLAAAFQAEPYRYRSVAEGRATQLAGILGVLPACPNPTTSTVMVQLALGTITPSQATVPCGTANFVVQNADPGNIHDFNLTLVTSVPADMHGPRLRSGQAATMTVRLPYKGSVYYYCNEPEHAESGESGYLTVR